MEWKIDWELSNRVINVAYEIHRELGPGLLERVYEECLCWHFASRGIPYERQRTVPLKFRELTIGAAFTADIIVDNRLIIEVKSVERLLSLSRAQLLTYLKMTGMKSGLLINFNSDPLKDGIQRVVNPR